MKYRIKQGGLWLACLLLCACKSNTIVTTTAQTAEVDTGATITSQTPESDKGFDCDYYMRNGFLTEDIALYHDFNERLMIYDVKSGKDLVFCFDPGCEHKRGQKSRTGEVIKKGCIAYEFYMDTVMLQGDHCYFMDRFTGEVYCSDRQGENRRLLGRIPTYIQANNVFFSKDALFAAYATQYEMIEIQNEGGEPRWVIGDKKDLDTCGIARFDLKDGTFTEVFRNEGYNAMVSQREIRGDHLYFQYSYNVLPYMAPDGEMFGIDRPEEYKDLSVEEYRAEFERLFKMFIYDYDISTGELKVVLENEPVINVCFCKDFFAIAVPGSGKTKLYRYSGECFRELDYTMTRGIRSDEHLICLFEETVANCLMIDETTGEELKRVTLPQNTIFPYAIIGESCYGGVYKDGTWGSGNISAEDFWKGDFSKAVAFTTR